MQLGMVGLGRMGANLVRRLERAGHQCVVYDHNPDAVAASRRRAARSARPRSPTWSSKLDAPRAVWLHGAGRDHRSVVDELAGTAEPGRHVIDGGNSNYGDDIARADDARDRSIALRRLRDERRRVGPRTRLLPDDRRPKTRCSRTSNRSSARSRPASTSAPRTPGRTGEPAPEENGYLHCGPPGAGHFVKMVHNGIEYALMAVVRRGPQHPAPRERRDSWAPRSPTPRPRRCAIPSCTATTSTSPRSPRCGGGAAWSRRGSSTSRPRRCTSRPTSPSSRAA